MTHFLPCIWEFHFSLCQFLFCFEIPVSPLAWHCVVPEHHSSLHLRVSLTPNHLVVICSRRCVPAVCFRKSELWNKRGTGIRFLPTVILFYSVWSSGAHVHPSSRRSQGARARRVTECTSCSPANEKRHTGTFIDIVSHSRQIGDYFWTEMPQQMPETTVVYEMMCLYQVLTFFWRLWFWVTFIPRSRGKQILAHIDAKEEAFFHIVLSLFVPRPFFLFLFKQFSFSDHVPFSFLLIWYWYSLLFIY